MHHPQKPHEFDFDAESLPMMILGQVSQGEEEGQS